MAQIDKLFDIMLNAGASDLHLTEGQRPQIRQHGSIRTMTEQPELSRELIRSLLIEICSPDRWAHYEQGGDLDFAYSYESRARFRANYLKQYTGYGAVFRQIPPRIQTLEELNLPKILYGFAHFNSGLCLVTGPTGSGKSTTLAAIIDSINREQSKVILTIEEPIEFVHQPMKSTLIHREVGEHAHTFGDALRVASRQDADVILVGEMRDMETIDLALTAAELGTLVFGTLHTNSATKTIFRIIDVFPADEQKAVRETLAVALRAVCAQLLLKRSDKAGRVAVHEIMIQTRASSNLIREGKASQLVQVIMSNKALGMQLMDDSIEAALNKGIVGGEEAYMKAFDKDRFAAHAPQGLAKV